MINQHMASTRGLPREQANAVSDVLEASPWPEAVAVSMVETDELHDLWRVEAIYQIKPEPHELAEVLKHAELAPVEISITTIEDVDWVRQSLEGLAPVRAGKLVIHGAHDRSSCAPGTTGIEIDAGLAFGTGHHNTTKGCLIALQRVLKTTSPRNCLDVGCGSGVLAIAACKLLHIPTMASDIDPEAVLVARQNAKINGTANLVRCVTAAGLEHRVIAASAPYDLIFANILARPLVMLAPSLASALSVRGRLILSGLRQDQIQMVRPWYDLQGLLIEHTYIDGGWATLTLSHRKRGIA
ncbi:MAG: 50S ribosomal protein L11 methyltransferase [Anderseniella sp.]